MFQVCWLQAGWSSCICTCVCATNCYNCLQAPTLILVHSENIPHHVHVDKYYSPPNIRSLWYFHTVMCVCKLYTEKQVCCFSHLQIKIIAHFCVFIQHSCAVHVEITHQPFNPFNTLKQYVAVCYNCFTSSQLHVLPNNVVFQYINGLTYNSPYKFGTSCVSTECLVRCFGNILIFFIIWLWCRYCVQPALKFKFACVMLFLFIHFFFFSMFRLFSVQQLSAVLPSVIIAVMPRSGSNKHEVIATSGRKILDNAILIYVP